MSNPTKPTVCLAMILKNEGHIIKRCLDSAKPFIDSYFVIDTGSTDDTLEVVARELEDLPGVIKSEEWINFGANRSSLVKQAREQGYDYLLLADADMVFEGTDGCLDNLTADSYLIRLPGGFEYHMPYLVSTRPHWKYYGVTHEFLTAPDFDGHHEHLTDFVIHHYGDGGTRPEKFQRDYDLLVQASNDPLDTHPDRTAFYLAQTCRDMGNIGQAIEQYERRVNYGGWYEEVYWSLFQIADMTRNVEDYIKAWNYRPERAEALVGLVTVLNEKGLYHAAYTFACAAPTEPTQDILFIQRWAEDYGVKLQLAIAEFWIDHKEDSQRHFEELLQTDLPDDIRALVEYNLTFFKG